MLFGSQGGFRSRNFSAIIKQFRSREEFTSAVLVPLIHQLTLKNIQADSNEIAAV